MSVPEVYTLLLWVLIFMNTLGFIAFGLDKQSAKVGWSRASEASLLTLATVFGAFGCLVGMLVFHHKVNKKKFTITIPVMLVLQVALIWILGMGL